MPNIDNPYPPLELPVLQLKHGIAALRCIYSEIDQSNTHGFMADVELIR